MSLENTTVLGLTRADDAADRVDAIEQIRALTARGQRVLVVASASPDQHRAGVLKANRMPVTADSYEVAGAMIEPDLLASAALAGDLRDAGVAAVALDAGKLAPVTRGGALDAEPRLIDASALSRALRASPVVVLPGGVGRDFDGRLTSLGDGGGALTAVFIGERLALPTRVQLESGESTLPRKAGLFARRYDQRPGLVGASGLDLGVFDPSGTSRSVASGGAQPLRVALLGLGPVGRGVLDELLGAPDRYRVVGVALTSADARYASGLRPELVSYDVSEILTRQADVVINLSQDEHTLVGEIEQARLRGVNIVRGAGALTLAGQSEAPEPEGASDSIPMSTRRSWRGVSARRIAHEF